MDDSSYRLNFDLGKKNEIHHYSYRKNILKLVKFQSLVARCCKCARYSPANFTNFVYLCITHRNLHHF